MVGDDKCSLTNKELAESCDKLISDLCKNGAKSFVMTVPPNFNQDSDMILSELVRRFKELDHQMEGLKK